MNQNPLNISRSQASDRSGMTLVELLVVITILAIVTALVIPQVRMVNKDRNIREASRLVASTFARASERAINDGIAGVVIERNANIVDGTGVNYAGTTLYIMRQTPPYAGDTPGSVATKTGPFAVSIVEPWEQADLGIIQPGDKISFNHSAVQYEIQTVASSGSGTLDLVLIDNGVLPPVPGVTTPTASTYPFVVHRQPRRIESSRVDLPDGYVIDLRFSGPLNPAPDTTGLIPHAPRPFFYEVGTSAVGMSPVTYLFNGNGGLDRFYFGGTAPQLATTTQYFLVRELNVEEAVAGEEFNVLTEPANLWVTVNQVAGSANVAYIAPTEPDTSLPAPNRLGAQIVNSRNIAVQRQSAAQ